MQSAGGGEYSVSRMHGGGCFFLTGCLEYGFLSIWKRIAQSSDVLRRTDNGKECFIRDYLELLKLGI